MVVKAITIRTLDGIPVRKLYVNGRKGTWDGKDTGGTTVRPGIYYYMVRHNGGVLRGKIVLRK